MFTAVEKKNDVCKSHYFKSSNKKNPTKDIVNHEQRVSNLRCFARRKRTYTYENSHISVQISYIYIYTTERRVAAKQREEEQFDLSITSIMHMT